MLGDLFLLYWQQVLYSMGSIGTAEDMVKDGQLQEALSDYQHPISIEEVCGPGWCRRQLVMAVVV